MRFTDDYLRQLAKSQLFELDEEELAQVRLELERLEHLVAVFDHFDLAEVEPQAFPFAATSPLREDVARNDLDLEDLTQATKEGRYISIAKGR